MQKNMSVLSAKRVIQKYVVMAQWKANLSKAINISPEDALLRLSEFYFQEIPEFSHENIVQPSVDLQIIVPVYNVEKYLEDCIQSILSQSSSFSYRVVFVDDGSTDHSGEILDKYKENPIIEIIHTKNGGVSKARNIALRSIAGKYVMFVDSDDVLAPNSIQVLVETAFLYNAEIIEGSYQDFDDNGTKGVHCHMGKTCAYDSFNYFGFPWGKVIRSDRLTHFCFPEGFLFEDTVMSTLLYPECRNTYTVPDVVYYYRNNPAGITNTCTTNPRCIDTFWIMKYCLEERVRRGQSLQARDLERYLFAIYRNWGRTRGMPYDIQESIFFLTCQLIETAFGAIFQEYSGKYMKIFRTVKLRSFDAFLTLASNGYIE